jgi:arylsulfatase A-like enzyme
MVYNNIMSHEDWMPTLAAAAGDPDVVKKVAEGYKVGDKTVKQHLDGYNFVPFFQGKEQQSPRHEIFYFDQTGNLNAVRYDDWKVASIPPIESRRLGRSLSISGPSPFESAPHDSGMYVWWYADLLWLFVPIQGKIAEFGATLKE